MAEYKEFRSLPMPFSTRCSLFFLFLSIAYNEDILRLGVQRKSDSVGQRLPLTSENVCSNPTLAVNYWRGIYLWKCAHGFVL